MNEETSTETTPFDWNNIPQQLQDKGIDIVIEFCIKLAKALAIIYVGKYVILLIIRALRKVNQMK